MRSPRTRLLSTREVAEVLGASVETVRRLVHSGALTAIPLERHYTDERPRRAARWRIDPMSVAAWLTKAAGESPNPRIHAGILKRLGLTAR